MAAMDFRFCNDWCRLGWTEQIDFIIVQLGSVVSKPSRAALTTNLPSLPYTTGIHTKRSQSLQLVLVFSRVWSANLKNLVLAVQTRLAKQGPVCTLAM